MDYPSLDVSKQNRFHFIFLLLLKLLSFVFLKRKAHHIPSGEQSIIFGGVSELSEVRGWFIEISLSFSETSTDTF